jgi:hypothetical protein
MTAKDVKIDYYYSLKPTDFPLLEKLELYQNVPPQQSPSDLSLKIELRPDNTEDNRRLYLSFEGVVNLRLVPWSSFVQFSLIEIKPISDRQWEHLKYEVGEIEENTLSFLCRDFNAAISDGKGR